MPDGIMCAVKEPVTAAMVPLRLLRPHRQVELGVIEQREFDRLGQPANIRLSEQEFACALPLPLKVAPLQERHHVGPHVEDCAQGAAIRGRQRPGELLIEVGGPTAKHRREYALGAAQIRIRSVGLGVASLFAGSQKKNGPPTRTAVS